MKILPALGEFNFIFVRGAVGDRPKPELPKDSLMPDEETGQQKRQGHAGGECHTLGNHFAPVGLFFPLAPRPEQETKYDEQNSVLLHQKSEPEQYAATKERDSSLRLDRMKKQQRP